MSNDTQVVEVKQVNGAVSQPQAGQPSYKQLLAQVKRLEQLQASKSILRCKVSEKGGLSVYGMGRFPVTLYLSQWEALIKFMPEVVAFIQANGDKLSRKE